MEARQTIAFAKFADAAVAPAKADYVARGSLQYEFATEILQTPIQLLKINNAKAQIVEILHHLAANNMVMAHEDAPLKFIQMVQLLRFAGMDEIEAIWAQFKGNHAHRQWILNAAPAIGTPVALRFIKEKFVAGEVTIPEATQALVAAVHLVTADAEAIKHAALAFHPKVQEHAVLREIVMLGYGTFVYKFCAAHPNCAADHIKPIHDLVATAVANGDFKDIGLLLKAVGNAGHPASLKPIMKLLPVFGAAAANLPIRHQVNAILAMRNIAKREPKLVQPVALQLLMDRTLHPEIRMVSCIVLFETRPTIALVATVANMLKRETSMQTSLRASRSSARSFEAIYSKAKYLGENLDPVAVVILRAVKADKKIHGYQAAAYVDHAADRAQIIINALAEDNNWKMCADAVLLSKHKIMAKLAWGVECQEYAAIIKAESGALGPHPAARLKVQWVKIPGIFAHYGKRVADYIPGAAFMAGMRVHRADNDDKAIQVLMAVQAQRVLNIIVKTPKVKVSTMAHVNEFWHSDSIRLLYSAATAAQCSMVGRTLTTFNNRRYNNELPFACYQVLAQDCTPELKFMVLMKKDAATEENHINVKIANIDVDIFPAGSAMMVRVNGMDIPFANLPYKHPAGIKQEFYTPSSFVTKNAVSFAHSWVLPSQTCRDANQCLMTHKTVKLERNMDGQVSTCYSIEPVLRCLGGVEGIRVDLRDTSDAHVACRCSEQCA
uniref:Phosvitin n=1 Tax=Denticeps clupeoides TaxID=299321 RepID=A0AAY4DZ75_9TELE